MESSDRIKQVGEYVTNLLLEKNAAYGDSALNPANIFAKGSAVENLCCRIDDKLMRIKNRGIDDKTEDTLLDLIGYFILLKIAIENEQQHIQPTDNDISERQADGQATLYNSWECTSTDSNGRKQYRVNKADTTGR